MKERELGVLLLKQGQARNEQIDAFIQAGKDDEHKLLSTEVNTIG